MIWNRSSGNGYSFLFVNHCLAVPRQIERMLRRPPPIGSETIDVPLASQQGESVRSGTRGSINAPSGNSFFGDQIHFQKESVVVSIDDIVLEINALRVSRDFG